MTVTGERRRATNAELQRFADRQAMRLFEGYSRRSAWALAALAALRREAGGTPGANPALWLVTMEGLEPPDAPDRVTRVESAAFHALTLYAVHQQSRPESMHVRDVSLGDATRRLLAGGASESVRDRFQALAGSADSQELVVHLRSMVQLLRGAGIPLDYGLLARQIATFDTEQGRTATRQRWGRDLARSRKTN